MNFCWFRVICLRHLFSRGGNCLAPRVIGDANRLAVANAYPLVKESVPVGVPSGLGDEDLKLYIVPKGVTPINPPDLLDHLAGSLPYFMIPRYVESIESLPRTPGLEKIRWRDLSSLGVGLAWDRQQAGYKIKR